MEPYKRAVYSLEELRFMRYTRLLQLYSSRSSNGEEEQEQALFHRLTSFLDHDTSSLTPWCHVISADNTPPPWYRRHRATWRPLIPFRGSLFLNDDLSFDAAFFRDQPPPSTAVTSPLFRQILPSSAVNSPALATEARGNPSGSDEEDNSIGDWVFV